MHFAHSTEIWRDFPELAAGVLHADGITPGTAVDGLLPEHYAVARSRLATSEVAELPEIQAWRRAYARMGLKPTQYRCAAEALLRRFRKEGALPRIHPLVDLCNALSLRYAIPVAAFDVARVDSCLEVRPADGDEQYLTFSDETETPAPGEVIFADTAGRAHARRWVNRQSGLSAVRDTTSAVLVVVEALHATAGADVDDLVTRLAADLSEAWSVHPQTALLTASSPRFEF